MSFLGGAECSTAGNPLSQITKHVQEDKSFQRDRLVSRVPGGSLGAFRTTSSTGSQDEAVAEFLGRPGTVPAIPTEQQQRLQGQPLLEGSHGAPLRAQSTSPSWSGDFHNHGHAALGGPAFRPVRREPFSPDEFARFRQLHTNASSARSSPLSNAATPATALRTGPSALGMDTGTGMGMGMSGPGSFMPGRFYARATPSFQQPFAPQDLADSKGKGKDKVVELDDSTWEEQFSQLEMQDRDHSESLAMEPELDAMDDQLLHSETGFGDLESIWRGIQAEGEEALPVTGDMDRRFLDGFDDSFDWDSMAGRLGNVPVAGQYLFEEENLFKDRPDPFQEGIQIMRDGGNLSLAALAFEAATQRDPSHVEAWVSLGSAQAQNEKEDAAIRALDQALKLDPDNLAALMGLAVSYTNEGYDSTAYRTLERWLSVKYPQIIAPDAVATAPDMGFTDRIRLHEKVTDEFIQAARLSPGGELMDPDVQVGLGVLLYGAEEYDKAVDCFEAALRSSELGTSNQRDQRHLLYNRLGATLANSGRSEEAIQAYEKALEIHPNFVRARYNLGVSCINIGCPAQAADHLLTALEMHMSVEKSGRERAREILGGRADVPDAQIDAGAQNRSTTLYDTLRRVFTQMGRRDLAEKVVVGVDPDVFRGQFDL